MESEICTVGREDISGGVGGLDGSGKERNEWVR